MKKVRGPLRVSIRQITLLLNTAVILTFSICLGYLFFRMYSQVVLEKYEKEQAQMLSYLKNSLEESLISIRQIGFAAAQNNHLIKQLLDYDPDSPPLQQNTFFNNMSDNLQTIANTRPEILSVNILTDRVRGNNAKPNGVYHYDDYFTHAAMAETIMQKMDCLLPIRESDISLILYNQNIITYSRRIYTNIFNGYAIGHVVINYKQDIFYKTIKEFLAGHSTVTVLLMDENGRIITGSDRGLFGQDLHDTAFSWLGGFMQRVHPNGETADLIIPGDSILSAVRMDSVGWNLVSVSQYDEVMRPVTSLHSQVMLLSVMVSVLFIVLGGLLSNLISAPVRAFAAYVKNYRHGEKMNFRPRRVQRIAEIDILYRSFDRMIDQIDWLLIQLYEEENSKKRAELDILQAQINPHFLYNTLDSINWMALLAGQRDLSKMVVLLGNFLRLSLNKGKNVYRVRDELEHLRSYMQIQSIRYGGRIVYSEDVEETLNDLYMVKLLIQPMVENCVLHAFEGAGGTGRILLTARGRDDHIIFTIADDGCGIAQDKLAHLFSLKGAQGFGLKNVDQRIKMYYGDRYGISISSTPGKGTQVVVTIPQRTDNFEAELLADSARGGGKHVHIDAGGR